MKHPLTKRQAEALKFIRFYIKEKAYSPTVQEIANGLGIGNRAGAARLVHKLEMRGHIARIPGATRSISLVTDEREELSSLRQVKDAATVYVTAQKAYGELFSRDKNSPETREAGPKVAKALERLQEIVA